MTITAPRTTRPPRPERAAGAPSPDAATVASMLAKIAQVQTAGPSSGELLPERLSPSRAADFKQCPHAFYLKTIVKLSSPPTEATTRGTLAHAAFERTFDHPAHERTPALAKSYIRPAWEQLVNPGGDIDARGAKRARQQAEAYRALAPAGSEVEARILTFAEQMVDNWFAMERVANFDPTHLTLPSGQIIDGRELRIGASMFGVYLHGFIDRLDSWSTPHGLAYSVTDYKSGRVPAAGKTYAPHVMARIEQDAFFQLRVYALLAWEVYQIPVKLLRLVYVSTGDREAGIKTLQVTSDVIEQTRAEVRAIWNQINRAARNDRWQTAPSKLCSWCWFLDICPAFEDAAPEQAASA